MINRIYIILVLSSSKLQIGRTGNNSKFCESSKVPTPNSNKYFKKSRIWGNSHYWRWGRKRMKFHLLLHLRISEICFLRGFTSPHIKIIIKIYITYNLQFSHLNGFCFKWRDIKSFYCRENFHNRLFKPCFGYYWLNKSYWLFNQKLINCIFIPLIVNILERKSI